MDLQQDETSFEGVKAQLVPAGTKKLVKVPLSNMPELTKENLTELKNLFKTNGVPIRQTTTLIS